MPPQAHVPSHARALRRTRKLLLILAATGSLVAGFALVWAFAPRAFRPLSTFELVVILGLLVLPVATVLAILSDRRSAVHAASEAEPPRAAPPAAATAVAHPPLQLPRVQTHPPSARPARVGQVGGHAHEHA